MYILLTIYILGCIVGFLYSIRTMKKDGMELTASDIIIAIAMSLLSWVCVIALAASNKYNELEEEEW